MQDFLCVECGKRWEELIIRGENRFHCDEPAQKLIGAPSVHYKEGRRFPALGGKEASSSREVDALLAKEGQYVPTAYESKQLRDLVEDPNFDPVAVGPKPDDPKIGKAVEKAMDRMYSEGREMPHDS
jgi:hypothetical protein